MFEHPAMNSRLLINRGEALMQTCTQHFIAVKRANSFSNMSPPLLPSTDMDCDWPPRCVVSLPNMVKLRSEEPPVCPLPLYTDDSPAPTSISHATPERKSASLPPKSDRIIYVNPSSFHHITSSKYVTQLQRCNSLPPIIKPRPQQKTKLHHERNASSSQWVPLLASCSQPSSHHLFFFNLISASCSLS